jgi:AcrR family transcriptional regulator
MPVKEVLMAKKIDRRTERTHKAIIEAFTSLILEKDFSEITVTEITKRAEINRKTFYSHYNCIEDVLDELQIETADRLVEIYRKNNKGPFDINAFTTTLNEILAENYRLYKHLLVASEYRFFSRNIRDSLKDAFIAQYAANENVEEEVLNLSAEFCVAGLVKIYRTWFENDSKLDQHQLAKLVGTLVWGGMQAVLEENVE